MYLASRKIIDSVDNAWYWLGGISLVLFIGIMAALIYFVVKYHRSRHPKAEHIPGIRFGIRHKAGADRAEFPFAQTEDQRDSVEEIIFVRVVLAVGHRDVK